MRNVNIKYCKLCYLKIKKLRHKQDIISTTPPEISEITSNIFIGNLSAAKTKSLLQAENISNIWITGYYWSEFFPKEFKYKTVEIDDNVNENLLSVLVSSINFIDNSKGKVLVHCRWGISRSSSIVIAYIMYKLKLSFSSAFDFVLSKRKTIAPNKGFIAQLKWFDSALQEGNYDIEVVNQIILSTDKIEAWKRSHQFDIEAANSTQKCGGELNYEPQVFDWRFESNACI